MASCMRLSLLVLSLALAVLHGATGESLDADARVTVVGTDGRERELSAAEFEALAKERAEAQSFLQQPPAEEWRRDQALEDVAREDPALARLIWVARRAFGALQRLGFAPEEFAMTGFSEKEDHREAASEDEGELRVVLELQAAPKGGDKVAFDVDVLLDTEHRVYVLSSWELDGPGGERVRQLPVDGEAALGLQQKARTVKLLLLGGGLVLIAGGALVLYGSRPPTWAKAKERAEREAKARKAAGKTTASAAQQQWTLDAKKAQ